jgi:hypothetical protein
MVHAPDLFGDDSAAFAYDASAIEVLEGLEPVRKRPGMYVGGTDERALHHLVAEVLDNAMDEAVAGHANRIEVELDADFAVTIRDNGRGMPVDPHPRFPGRAIAAMFTSWFIASKPDLSMALNGILAGLVGITAGADSVSPLSAIIIGFIAGGLVVGAVLTFDKMKIDDPVGATSVHLVCGIWGTLAVGIFSQNENHNFVTQLIGVGAYAAFTLVAAFIIFFAVKSIMGLRVSEEEEHEGLDYGEHGSHGYDFTLGGPALGGRPVDAEGDETVETAAKLASSES